MTAIAGGHQARPDRGQRGGSARGSCAAPAAAHPPARAGPARRGARHRRQPAGALAARPADATSNFVQGVDWWATLLALEIDGRAEVAMISASAMGRRWWATRGQGAWTTGPLDPSPRPLAVSRVDDLAGAHLAYGDLCLDPWFADLAGRCWRARGIGDFLMFCLLAEGALWTWRSGRTTSGHGAGRAVLLVTEAGGCVTDLAGRPWTEGQVAVASNRVLHAAVLASIPGPAGRDPHDPAGTRQLSPAPFPNPDTRDGSRAAVLP